MSRFIYYPAERRYAECRYAECRYAECHYGECRYTECRYAECHFGECRYNECRSATNIIVIKDGSILIFSHSFFFSFNHRHEINHQ